MNRRIREKDSFRKARCSTEVLALKTCFRFRDLCLLIPLISPEYMVKSQPSTSRRRTRRPLGHWSEEICAFSTMSFDNTSARPLHLLQVLALPPDDITRRLKKPELYLSTTITIRVEMTPLITESRSDYQHTSILTHSNSTTTTIRQKMSPSSKMTMSVH